MEDEEDYIDGDVDEPVTITTSFQTYEDVELPQVVKISRKAIDGQRRQIWGYVEDKVLAKYARLHKVRVQAEHGHQIRKCITKYNNR